MTETPMFESVLRDIRPSDTERAQVQRQIDQATRHLLAWNPPAEVHPCGSWAKRTMLAGRKEADLVFVMSRAPDDRTLEELAAHMARLPGLASRPTTTHKAVALSFNDGVKLDLLPVAKDGRTPEGPSAPRKLRLALRGIEHVRWFAERSAGTQISQAVLLLKHLKRLHAPAFDGLPSFALEVATINLARSRNGRAGVQLLEVLEALAGGALSPNGRSAFLPDPAEPSQNILEDTTAAQLRAVQAKAAHLVQCLRNGERYSVFPADGPLPGPASNLGGRTLA